MPYLNTPYGSMTPNVIGGVNFTPNINKTEVTSPSYRYADSV